MEKFFLSKSGRRKLSSKLIQIPAKIIKIIPFTKEFVKQITIPTGSQIKAAPKIGTKVANINTTEKSKAPFTPKIVIRTKDAKPLYKATNT